MYKLSEFKKTQIMKNKHVLLTIKESNIAVYAVMLLC